MCSIAQGRIISTNMMHGWSYVVCRREIMKNDEYNDTTNVVIFLSTLPQSNFYVGYYILTIS